MADQHTQAYCRECECRVRATRPGTNHILHLLLSVITMGFWVVVWILAAVKIGGWSCPHCGSRKLRFKSFGMGTLPK